MNISTYNPHKITLHQKEMTQQVTKLVLQPQNDSLDHFELSFRICLIS